MSDELIKEATGAVLKWIAEKHGEDVAGWWFWDCTPMPCWFPSDEQLNDGLRLAAGEISVAQLSDKVNGMTDYEMRRMAAAGGNRQEPQK